MRRRLVLLPALIVLAGCTASIEGQGARAVSPYSADEVAGWTEDGDVPGVESEDGLPTTHVTEDVDYEQSPPFGGPHDIQWADCTGIVYDVAIRPENALHSLEHGAVWLTYSPELPAEDVGTLEALIAGTDYTMLSPYPGLETAVSAQSWGRRLAVESVDDPRLGAFLLIYRMNPITSPEPGAPCSNPEFAASPRTPGS